MLLGRGMEPDATTNGVYSTAGISLWPWCCEAFSKILWQKKTIRFWMLVRAACSRLIGLRSSRGREAVLGFSESQSWNGPPSHTRNAALDQPHSSEVVELLLE